MLAERLEETQTLLYRIRYGLVGIEDVKLASRLGNKTARKLFPREVLAQWEILLTRKIFLFEVGRNRAVLFAILCAEKRLPVFEKELPDDDRPRKAIEAARRYWRDPTKDNGTAASAAAAAAKAAATAAAEVSIPASRAASCVASSTSASVAAAFSDYAADASRASSSEAATVFPWQRGILARILLGEISEGL